MIFGIEKLANRFRRKNWLGETFREEMERRVRALEIHCRQLSLAHSELYAKVYEGVIVSDRYIEKKEVENADGSL